MAETLVLSQEDFNKIDRLIQIKASRSYYGQERASFDVEDLYQEGWLALMESWHRFDSTKHVKFLTFANARITYSMLDFVKYMLTGLRGQDKTGERRGKREIYFDDDPSFNRSLRYQAQDVEHKEFLIDIDISLSLIGASESERYLFVRYHICDDSFDKIASDVDISRPTINRVIRKLDKHLCDHFNRKRLL